MGEPQQSDLFSLLPGVRGGRALAQRRGRAYMQTLGQQGGQTTRDRYGIDYFREIGRLGRQARRDRIQRQIRFISFAEGETHKIVPYLPVGRRRKRPIFVRFWLNEGEV